MAIIKLSEDIEFNNNVQPACLPEVDTVYEPGKKCFISGWGRTGDGKVLFLIRHPLTLPVKYSWLRLIRPHQNTDKLSKLSEVPN